MTLQIFCEPYSTASYIVGDEDGLRDLIGQITTAIHNGPQVIKRDAIRFGYAQNVGVIRLTGATESIDVFKIEVAEREAFLTRQQGPICATCGARVKNPTIIGGKPYHAECAPHGEKPIAPAVRAVAETILDAVRGGMSVDAVLDAVRQITGGKPC